MFANFRRIKTHALIFNAKPRRRKAAKGLTITFLRRLSCKITRMKLLYFCLFIFAFCLFSACRPAAAPKAISNKPVSVNDVPLTNQPLPPTKPVEEMTWAALDGRTNEEGAVSTLKDFQGKVVILGFLGDLLPAVHRGNSASQSAPEKIRQGKSRSRRLARRRRRRPPAGSRVRQTIKYRLHARHSRTTNCRALFSAEKPRFRKPRSSTAKANS